MPTPITEGLKEKKIEVYIDGAAWLWHKCSYAFIVKEGDSWLHSEYGLVPVSPKEFTSNAAEHYAMYKALRWLLDHAYGDAEVTIRSDSKLVISQIFRGWQCRDENLPYAQFYKMNVQLLPLFSSIKGKLIPRRMNTQADELAKVGINEAN